MLALASLLAVSCEKGPKPFVTLSGLHSENFVTTIGDQTTELFALTNDNGMEVCITNFGGRIVSIMVPDKDTVMRDVVLGFDNVQDYINVPSDFGASIGRYANRIANGKFTLDGVEYTLPTNNNGHTLHGGPEGWQYKVYTVEDHRSDYLQLGYTSEDGEMGFPGKVKVTVFFLLTANNELAISYVARSEAPTVVNFTNHSYFNLSGDPTKPITDHVLAINASQTTPVDELLIPNGKFAKVDGTPFDFRTPKPIGQVIEAENEQLTFGRGYDHNWVLDSKGDATKPAAMLVCPETGICLAVFTTEPGIQVYTGNFLDGTVTGKGGIAYPFRSAVCLETQHFPDSPNKDNFPSTVLRPGEKFETRTTYRFSVLATE